VQTLDSMSRSEKQLAIERIRAPATSALHMPPPARLRELTAPEIELVSNELAR
jgi:hypothetical protein